MQSKACLDNQVNYNKKGEGITGESTFSQRKYFYKFTCSDAGLLRVK